METCRIEKQLQKSSALAKRILTENEFARFEQHAQPARFVAKRFAAKEAAVKALGTGIGNGIGWQQIEIQNLASGQPQLHFSGEFALQCQQRNITSSLISISDEQHYAVATVILQG